MDPPMLDASRLPNRAAVMNSTLVEQYAARYVVIKNSWKGKYTRMFCIGSRYVATIDAQSIFHVTNRWDYRTQLFDVMASPENLTEFRVIISKGNKNETLIFFSQSAMERAELLTDVHRNQLLFEYTDRGRSSTRTFSARKYCFNESYQNCFLRITKVAVEQLDHDGNVIGEYLFAQVKGLTSLIDNPHSLIVLYGPQMKMHLYETEDSQQVARLIEDFARRFIGLPPFRKVRLLSQQQFDSDRLGVDRAALAATAEFSVMKWSRKHRDAPVRRILATAKDCVVELDPETYNPISALFFVDMYAFVRCDDDDQRLIIYFKEPYITKVYTSSTRDTLLAHLVDCCRMLRNCNIFVVSRCLDRGKRAAPFSAVVPEEIESTLLNSLVSAIKGNSPDSLTLLDAVEFFNTNVACNGLRFTENRDGVFAENREKLIFSSLSTFLGSFLHSDDPFVVAQQFYALRRLCVTRVGFSSVALVPSILKTVEFVSSKALNMNNSIVSHAVIDFLNVLMTPHHNHYELAHEGLNKNHLLRNTDLLDHMLQMLHDYAKANTAALVVQALLDFFVYALCPPYSETTDATLFTSVMKKVVDTAGKELFTLMQHGCSGISYCAGQLIRVIMEEGSSEQFALMQQAALSKGGILGQLHLAIYCKNQELRDLARQLVAYWTYENSEVQTLLRGVFPLALLSYLQSKEEVPNDEKEAERQRNLLAMSNEFWHSKLKWFKKRFYPSDGNGKSTGHTSHEPQNNIVYKRDRVLNVKPTLNWPMLFYQVKQDHMRPELIWNHTTRTELREALEAEMEALTLGLGLHNDDTISWNYREFEVQYLSLKEELKIGQHYPRLLFETKEPVIKNPKEFFFDMYHCFLITESPKKKLSCLHGMRILYEHYALSIGQFNDMGYVVQLLETTMEPAFRDHLLTFILQLLRERANVKLFLDCDGLRVLVDLLTLAHLDLERPQACVMTNAIEGLEKIEEIQDQAKEWYYIVDGIKQEAVSYTQLKKMYENGEVNNSTKVWAQGLSGWMELENVSQLRWGIIVGKKSQLLTLTEVSCVILDILLQICACFPSRDVQGAIMQPVPRVKRYLSSPQVLPHIVQLLLTFNPEICSRVHSLLYTVMMDNPVMPRLFLTGLFFFAFMYTGSDVLPLSRLLHLTHTRQSFIFEHDNEVVRSSVLSRLLPPALVCLLTRHGPERFANVLLGEYETPEAIWGKDMRRYLVQKLYSHISDFTPRLLGNNRAIYQYFPIVDVVYEPLQDELFCSQYYLRHFCDEMRYPNWPVNDPIALLCDVLAAWRRELSKKPCQLTRKSCLKELEIEDDASITLRIIRTAYHQLAVQYHPDKNPEGRDKFERIHAAYEFLASGIQSASTAGFFQDKPNPHNIVLLLQTQSILLRRFNDVMVKYKYAGYGLLLKLIKMEYEDPEMLCKDVVLIEPATELCYFTVRNLPLNSDELQEEGGIELLSKVAQRCFELITPNDTDDENHVKVLRHCMHTFCFAAQFEDCHRHLIADPVICYIVARGIMCENAIGLSRACIQACKSFPVDEILQNRLLKFGAIWYLLLFLFCYDYTLQDSGVEVQEEHHTQLFTNRAAVYALQAIYALSGIRPSDAYVQTNVNEKIIRLLQRLLTPYVVRKMQLTPGGENEILKIINSTHETPYLLWNKSNIRELENILKTNAEKYLNAGMNTEELSSLIDDDSLAMYSLHQGELIIAGIFVRIYNEQPTFPIEDPVEFCSSIIKFIKHQQSNEYETAGVVQALEAIKNLLNAYTISPLISVLEKQAHVLLDVLLYEDAKINAKVAEVLEKASLHHNFVEVLGKIDFTITNVIFVLDRGDSTVEQSCLALLRVICGNRGVVQQALDRGLYVILLSIIGKTADQNCRENACVALAKCCMDKLCGPKVFLRASKLIPAVMLETMKENVVNACHLLDTWQETPELVWTREKKERFLATCAACQNDIITELKQDPKAYWNIPENVVMERVDEIQVAGVYLDLYLKQQGWKVRKPKEFITALLERFMEECGKAKDAQNEDLIDLITNAGLRLLQTSPAVTDAVASLGYAQKLLKLMVSEDIVIGDAALKWTREVCASRIYIESLVNTDPISLLLVCLRYRPQRMPLVLETMERLFLLSSNRSNMVSFALHNRLPQYLLELLETGLTPEACGDKPPSVLRALIIKVLKVMLAHHDPVCSPKLEAILAKNRVWAKYKDQSHELFLSDVRTDGYLEGFFQQQQKLLPAHAITPSLQNVNDLQPPPL